MPTPHADRLHGIESWSPSSIQDSFAHFDTVSAQLRFIADTNRRIVANLGMEGRTADAARRYFDRVATDLYDQAEKIDQMARVVKDIMNGGIEAKNHSIQIQADLALVNDTFANMETAGKSGPLSSSVIAEVNARRAAAHAEIDRRAKEVLHTLNVRTLNGIASLPYQEHLRQELKSSNPALIERLERHEAAQRHGPATGNRGASPGSAVASGPARSATAWHTPGRDVSLGSPGSHTAPGGGGSHSPGDVGLQSSHYTPVQSGTVGSSSVPGSDLGVLNPGKRVSAVHDHLAAAAAAAGGPAAVLGYRAYRAARAAAAAKSAPVSSSPARSGAAIRSAPPAKTSGLLRGATTAARATTPTTPASSAGRSARGGATGAARPVPSSSQGRPSGFLRGATTAQRARVPVSSSRGSGILKGTLTVARKTTDSPASAGRPGSVNDTGSRTRAGNTRTRAGNTRAAASGSRTGTASRASNSRGAEARSASSSRGGSARGAQTRKTSTARGASDSQTAPASPKGSASRKKGSKPRDSAFSRALAALIGQRRASDKQHDDQASAELRPVSPYENDKTITFLPAGSQHTADDNN